MAKQIERLTALQVARISTPGTYPDGAGLYLQVANGGSKSWLLRYTLSKRQRWMGLDSFRTFGLAEARERAKAQRKVLADGIDPIDEKKSKLRENRAEADGAITFDKAAELFIEANRTSWTNLKHADQWLTTLKTYASPVIG